MVIFHASGLIATGYIKENESTIELNWNFVQRKKEMENKKGTVTPSPSSSPSNKIFYAKCANIIHIKTEEEEKKMTWLLAFWKVPRAHTSTELHETR